MAPAEAGSWSERPEQLVAAYLADLEEAGRSMAPAGRRAAVAQIRALLDRDLLRRHASAAEVKGYLDELGTPEAVIEQAVASGRRRGSSVGIACLTAFLLPICWPLGVPLLWWSRYWTRAEKWVATCVVPGGVPAAFYLWPLVLHSALGPVWGEAAGIVLPLLSAGMAIYLVVTFVLRVDDEALGIGA